MSKERYLLNHLVVRRMVQDWLSEDIPNFDVGGSVVGSDEVTATFYAKSDLLLAGKPFVEELYHQLNCTITWTVDEGVHLEASSKNRIEVGHVTGPAYAVLQGERTALELLSRCSACCTYTNQCVNAALLNNKNWTGRVACTRKTTPGSFREVEKYGVIIGGGDPHRYCLSSMVMLKDNHIDIAGSITKAVTEARKNAGFSMKIEVECRSVEDALVAAGAGADVVMLDNFSPEEIGAAVPVIREKFPHIVIEASGGITIDTVRLYAQDGVDIVSIGRITHGPPPVDISMKIKTH